MSGIIARSEDFEAKYKAIRLAIVKGIVDRSNEEWTVRGGINRIEVAIANHNEAGLTVQLLALNIQDSVDQIPMNNEFICDSLEKLAEASHLNCTQGGGAKGWRFWFKISTLL